MQSAVHSACGDSRKDGTQSQVVRAKKQLHLTAVASVICPVALRRLGGVKKP